MNRLSSRGWDEQKAERKKIEAREGEERWTEPVDK